MQSTAEITNPVKLTPALRRKIARATQRAKEGRLEKRSRVEPTMRLVAVVTEDWHGRPGFYLQYASEPVGSKCHISDDFSAATVVAEIEVDW